MAKNIITLLDLKLGIGSMMPFEVSNLIKTRTFSTARNLLFSDEEESDNEYENVTVYTSGLEDFYTSENENAYTSEDENTNNSNKTLVDCTAHFVKNDTVDYEGGNNTSDDSSVGSIATGDIIDNCKNKSNLGVKKHFEVKEFELGGARNIKQRRNPTVEDFDKFEQKAKDIDRAHDEKLANLKRKLPKVMSAIKEHRIGKISHFIKRKRRGWIERRGRKINCSVKSKRSDWKIDCGINRKRR